LESLSEERITDEMKKLLLKSEKPSIGFELMRDIGLVARTYPGLFALIDTPQEPEWHPEGDVWIHTMMVIDASAHVTREQSEIFSETDALSAILGSLCHDFGKPETTKLGEKDGAPRIRSLGHSRAGLKPTEDFLSQFCFGTRVVEDALACVLEHLKPGQLFFSLQREDITAVQYDNAVRKLVKKHAHVPWQVILATAEADFRGRALPEANGPYEAGEIFKQSVLKQGLDNKPVQPLIRGEDLLTLGVRPGVHMGELIQLVEHERDAGHITTKEEALERVKKELG